jgi:hypothetical protein
MYSTPHAAVGIAIVTSSISITGNLTSGLIIGGILAILSHYPIDYLKEGSLGKFMGKTYIKYEIITLALILLCGLIGGYLKGGFLYSLCLFGIYFYSLNCSILFDLIDKKFGLSTINPSKYPSTNYFHKQKRGIKFSNNQTKLVSLAALIIVILITIIFLKNGI